jgi:hypothetical protein
MKSGSVATDMVLAGVQFELKMDRLRQGIIVNDLLRVHEQGMKIYRTGLEKLELTVRNPGQIEQVVDEARFELDIAPHHTQLLTKLRFNPAFLF